MSKYKINSEKTQYGRTLFKSRLECRWAIFFDILGWSWKYEPKVDRYYRPDFLIRNKDRYFFIEVKPIDQFDLSRFNAHKAEMFARKHFNADKLDNFVFVGLSPSRPKQDYCPIDNAVLFGWNVNGDEIIFRDANRSSKLLYDICNSLMSYEGILTGQYDGDTININEAVIYNYWNEACKYLSAQLRTNNGEYAEKYKAPPMIDITAVTQQMEQIRLKNGTP